MSLTDVPGEPPSKSLLQKIIPFTSVAVLIAMAYAGWTLYSRHEDNARFQQKFDEKQQADRQRILSQVFGSGEIRFNSFSAANHLLKRGETTQLCYGVENAKTLKLDPPLEEAKPTYRHCLTIAPTKTTTYTLTATDNAGHTQSRSLEVQVR
jgi:hypothetical protein